MCSSMEATCENMVVLNSFPDENRSSFINEMDFFSSSTSFKSPLSVNVKEDKQQDGDDQELQLNLNMGSSPTTPSKTIYNSGSPNNQNSTHKLAILQNEVRKMKIENEGLQSMVSQVREKYLLLQRYIQENMVTRETSDNYIKMTNVMKEDPKRSLLVPLEFKNLNQTTKFLDDHNIKTDIPDGDRVAAEATMRRARVSVRARSEASMISDGCQWRKYGQKLAKGNPCPRAYYRCTMAPSCPVRKQVQRCAEDRSVLTTTYEGTHNHPLPQAAMTMAATTSAAASMLLTGSISSSNNFTQHLTQASMLSSCHPNLTTTLSSTAPFPTVTLDLTNPNNSVHSDQNLRHEPPFQFPFSTNMNPNINGPNRPLVLGQFAAQQNNATMFSGVQRSNQELMSRATAAVTADPNFMTALAAAIGSIIGSGRHNDGGNNANDNDNNFERN